MLNIKLANIDLNLSKGMLWIPTIDSSTLPNFVSVIFKIRDVDSNTMYFLNNSSDNTISILGGYVYDNENHVECGLRVVKSLLGLRLEIQNKLFSRHSSTILLNCTSPIRHQTFQGELLLE